MTTLARTCTPPVILLGDTEYVTTAEAVDRLGDDVTEPMIRQWRHRRLVPGYRVGNVTYSPWPALMACEKRTRHRGRARAA